MLNIEPLFSKFQRFFFCLSYVNFNSLPWPEPDLGHHDLNKLESTLRKDASTQDLAFLANWIWRKLLMDANLSIILNYIPMKENIATN